MKTEYVARPRVLLYGDARWLAGTSTSPTAGISSDAMNIQVQPPIDSSTTKLNQKKPQPSLEVGPTTLATFFCPHLELWPVNLDLRT